MSNRTMTYRLLVLAPLASALAALVFTSEARALTCPDPLPAGFVLDVVDTTTLSLAFQCLKERNQTGLPGGTVQLHPGVYAMVSRGRGVIPILENVKAKPDAPITIRGSGGTLVQGDGQPKVGTHFEKTPNISPTLRRGSRLPSRRIGTFVIPGFHDTNCIQMKNVSGIVVEDLTVQGCWPAFLVVEGAEYVTVRRLQVTGSTYVVVARDTLTDQDTTPRSHHFLIEHNRWIQDCTGYATDGFGPRGYLVDDAECLRDGGKQKGLMWTSIDWRCSHHNTNDPDLCKCPCGADWECECNEAFCSGRQFEFFNGALFGGRNIAGGVVFRHNDIWNAFNGIRVKAEYTRHTEPPERVDLDGKGNLNFEVYANRFSFVRDNPVEPESTAFNWRVFHNRIWNAHAWFAFDDVRGGEFYIFGNLGRFDDLPGRPGQGHRNGTVLKFAESRGLPERPIYVFNNSWYLRSPVAGRGRTSDLRHWNNAIRFCRPEPGVPGCFWLVEGGEAQPVPLVDPRFTFTGTWLDHDRISHPQFPELIQNQNPGAPPKEGQEREGRRVDPPFRNVDGWDFTIGDAEWAEGGRIPAWQDWPSRYTGAAPPVGAFDGSALIEGPPYFHCGWLTGHPYRARCLQAYPERPRVMGVAWRGSTLEIAFSVPVRLPGPVRVEVRGGGGSALSEPCTVTAAVLACPFPQAPAPMVVEAIVLARDIRSAEGNLPMTLWARPSQGPRIEIR
ncbi:MAG TPA: hypothetical protein VGW35_17025 [Methylomirabilota bacterium]|nr:hypothetical protein [Methylomirabilota bacterium]